MRKTGQILNCLNCQKEFYARGSWIKANRLWCSWQCYDEMRRIKRRPCPVCGTYYRPNKKQQTCSYRCSKFAERNPNWKGDEILHNTTGNSRARRRFQANHCDRCKTTGLLYRHHVDREPRNNTASNIEILCPSCHNKEHWKDRKRAKDMEIRPE